MSAPYIRWTPALDTWLSDTFPHNQSGHLAAVIGCSAAALRMRATTLGLHKSHEWRSLNSSETTRARSPFTPPIIEIIDLMYADMRTADLAEFIGLTISSVHKQAHKRGLRKSKDLVRQMARDRMTPEHAARRHQFPKGHVPANKGVKGVSYPGMEATQFKKGQRSHTWRPIGSERTDADGYLLKKMHDTGYPPHDWVPVHHLLWEEVNGAVPQGHSLSFRDGNRKNVVLGNLELITHAERMRRNSYHTTMPPELRTLVHARAILTRAINKRTRAAQEQTA